MENTTLTKGLTKAIVSIFAYAPAEHASKLLFDLVRVFVSDFNIKRIAGNIGEQLKLNEESPFTLSEFSNLKLGNNNPEVAYIQVDGGMVPIKGEKAREYKENKLGLVFTDKDIEQIRTKSNKNRVVIKNKKFVASLGEGVEPFRKLLSKAAILKKATFAKTLVVLGDGADWIRNLQEKSFPQAIRILDWYHAVEHLWSAARQIFGENQAAKCKQWVKLYETQLWNGEVDRLLSNLQKEAYKYKGDATPFWKLYNYYYKNKKAMNYVEYRRKGLFIGSGCVESAHKYITTARLKQAGMQWTIRNAIGLIWVRCLIFEGRWDQFWENLNKQTQNSAA